MGCNQFPLALGVCELVVPAEAFVSDFGNPLAAAAQERRVVRLARRASSCCAAAL